MKHLLLALLLLPLHAASTEKTAGEPVEAMALVERDGNWQLLPTQLQSYLDEFGALAEIRSSVTDAKFNLVDTRLRPGPVTALLALEEASTCYNDSYEPKVFTKMLIQAGEYHLECRGDVQGNRQLLFSSSKGSQTLPDNDPPIGSWQLIWAGDLDRDGQPDLVGEYSVEGGYCQQVLLSTAALPDQLLAAGEPYCLAD